MSPKLAVAFTWPFFMIEISPHIIQKKKKILSFNFSYISEIEALICVRFWGTDAGREKKVKPLHSPIGYRGRRRVWACHDLQPYVRERVGVLVLVDAERDKAWKGNVRRLWVRYDL
jgi:hypothetical protein